LGVVRFYLRVEDTPELEALLTSASWASRVDVTWDNTQSNKRDYEAQTVRQSAHAEAAIARAASDGLTHLVHLDDDELFYCPDGIDALRRAVGSAPSRILDFHALTMEALVPAECDEQLATSAGFNPFRACRAFRHVPQNYTSYGMVEYCAGKSLGALRPDLTTCGPHHFTSRTVIQDQVDALEAKLQRRLQHLRESGVPFDLQTEVALEMAARPIDHERTLVLPPRVAVLLHYESAHYGRWRDKFCEGARQLLSGNGDASIWMANKWYRQSIEAWARQLRAEHAGVKLSAPDRPHSVWRRAKTAPPELVTPPPTADYEAGHSHVLRDQGITVFARAPGGEEPEPMSRGCASLCIEDRKGPRHCRQSWRAFRKCAV
jgi:hypothetical protein